MERLARGGDGASDMSQVRLRLGRAEGECRAPTVYPRKTFHTSAGAAITAMQMVVRRPMRFTGPPQAADLRQQSCRQNGAVWSSAAERGLSALSNLVPRHLTSNDGGNHAYL
jgi:hypothetical protein